MPAAVEDQIVRLRKELTRQGVDAGADTIRTHLSRHLLAAAGLDADATPAEQVVPSVATIWRILTRRGFVTPQPQKRPKSSWQRFAAD